MIAFVLWIVTSNYAVEMATYPSAGMCAHVLVEMDASLSKPPRAVMAEVMCVPTMIIPPMMRARPEAPAHPSAES